MLRMTSCKLCRRSRRSPPQCAFLNTLTVSLCHSIRSKSWKTRRSCHRSTCSAGEEAGRVRPRSPVCRNCRGGKFILQKPVPRTQEQLVWNRTKEIMVVPVRQLQETVEVRDIPQERIAERRFLRMKVQEQIVEHAQIISASALCKGAGRARSR